MIGILTSDSFQLWLATLECVRLGYIVEQINVTSAERNAEPWNGKV